MLAQDQEEESTAKPETFLQDAAKLHQTDGVICYLNFISLFVGEQMLVYVPISLQATDFGTHQWYSVYDCSSSWNQQPMFFTYEWLL